MKNTFHISAIILAILFLMPTVNADSPITGTAYGENIGLIHFDYTTATNPFDKCTDPYDTSPTTLNCPLHAEYSSYHSGPRENFYISPMDTSYDTSAYNSNFTAKIDDSNTCTNDHCLLDGFLWSDAIGWIALSGSVIQSSIGNIDFPDGDFARISTSNGVLSGFIWSEKTGWIKLASDGFDSTLSQTQSNWGVWMNLYSDSESPLVSSECTGKSVPECNAIPHICNWNTTCQPIPIEIGRPLQGNAWSQKLGWIKFNSAGEFFNGAYTTWIPDITPPEFHVDEDNIWFANDDVNGTLTWENFASDPESGIDTDETKFSITTTDIGCALEIDDTDGDSSNNSNLFINPATQRLRVTLPTYGIVDATTAGYCKYELTAKLVNGVGLTTDVSKTFFVRAGDYDANGSSVSASTNAPNNCIDQSNTAIADGKDCYEYHFNPVDIVNNPIVPVKVNRAGDDLSAGNPANWMRESDSKFVFDSATYFDQILPPPSGSHTVPISFDGGSNAISQNNNEQIEYMTTTTVGYYPVRINAFAPTDGNNSFDINSAAIDTRESSMPRVSEYVLETPANNPDEIAYNSNIMLSFAPAIKVISGSLDKDLAIAGVSMEATYAVKNQSTKISINKYAIDNKLFFENKSGSTGYGKEVLDMRNIGAIDSLIEDSPIYLGRTDPVSNGTRYLVMTSLNNKIDNTFHTSTKNYHPSAYNFMIDVGTNSEIRDSGQYEVNGIYDLTKGEKDKLNDSTLIPQFTYENIFVDRNDIFTTDSFNLSTTKDFSFSITPNQYGGVPHTRDVIFEAKQYVAYNVSPDNLNRYTVYEETGDYISADFESIGLQATGKVIGENIYDTTGRDLDAVSPTDSSELKRMIRNNVANITRNMSLESCGRGNVSTLPTATSECVVIDDINKTIIAVYTSSVVLTDNITVPSIDSDNYSYTLLLRDGADLTIKGNILPGDSIAFGIIALADENGDGGNVYIDPAPTDIHALLYAEGSLISRNNNGDCYRSGNTCDLKNQLYWKGSIVSRNTIGGAPNATLPPGISRDDDCGANTDAFICAQKFDMDYLRRFTVNGYDGGSGIIGHYTATGVKYSGGNSCNNATPPKCTFTGDTTMTVTDIQTNQLIDLGLSKSYDTVFVEKDTKPAPPGFSTSAGFSRSQTIR